MEQTMIVGVVTTLVGMGVVFSVLVLLSCTTWLLNKIVDATSPEGKAERATQAAKAVAPAPAVAPVAPVAAKGLSPQVVAAITAAIVSITGTAAADLKFTAIKRVGGANLPWATSGSTDIMANRQRFTEGGNR